MYPFIEIFGRSIGSYGVVAVVASIICGALFLLLLKRSGEMMEDGISLIMFIIAGSVIGSHLLFAITQIHRIPSLFQKAEFSVWLHRLQAIFGGSVFYGGLIGGIGAGFIGTKICKLNLQLYSDLMAPIVPLLHGITRIGCFLAGCCYGIPCSFGFAATGNTVIPDVNGIVRFPVQLLEAGCNIILGAIMLVLLKRSQSSEMLKGELFKIYLISYGFIRFADEFLRGDEVRGRLWVLSTSQWISIAIVTLCSVLLVRSVKAKKQIYDAATD